MQSGTSGLVQKMTIWENIAYNDKLKNYIPQSNLDMDNMDLRGMPQERIIRLRKHDKAEDRILWLTRKRRNPLAAEKQAKPT